MLRKIKKDFGLLQTLSLLGNTERMKKDIENLFLYLRLKQAHLIISASKKPVDKFQAVMKPNI